MHKRTEIIFRYFFQEDFERENHIILNIDYKIRLHVCRKLCLIKHKTFCPYNLNKKIYCSVRTIHLGWRFQKMDSKGRTLQTSCLCFENLKTVIIKKSYSGGLLKCVRRQAAFGPRAGGFAGQIQIAPYFVTSCDNNTHVVLRLRQFVSDDQEKKISLPQNVNFFPIKLFWLTQNKYVT